MILNLLRFHLKYIAGQCAERSRPNLCSVCCGDSLCNGLSCFDLIGKYLEDL